MNHTHFERWHDPSCDHLVVCKDLTLGWLAIRIIFIGKTCITVCWQLSTPSFMSYSNFPMLALWRIWMYRLPKRLQSLLLFFIPSFMHLPFSLAWNLLVHATILRDYCQICRNNNELLETFSIRFSMGKPANLA